MMLGSDDLTIWWLELIEHGCSSERNGYFESQQNEIESEKLIPNQLLDGIDIHWNLIIEFTIGWII